MHVIINQLMSRENGTADKGLKQYSNVCVCVCDCVCVTVCV